MGDLIYADEIHRVKQSQIDAARITQASGNERRGAETALTQFSASLANLRRMDAAGSAVNDIASNITRLKDSSTKGRLSMRVQAAEELGRVSAMAGAAGVGGSSIDTYNQTLKLAYAMQEQEADRATDAAEFSASKQRGNVLKSAVAGMDNNVYRANLDYTQYVDHKKPSFFEQTLGLGLTAAATVFGGPQAGAAVMGVFESRQAARNGDYANASASMMGTFKNAYGAAKSYQATRQGPGAAAGEPDAGYVTAENYEYATELVDTNPGRTLEEARREIRGPDYKSFSFNNNTPSFGSITLR